MRQRLKERLSPLRLPQALGRRLRSQWRVGRVPVFGTVHRCGRSRWCVSADGIRSLFGGGSRAYASGGDVTNAADQAQIDQLQDQAQDAQDDADQAKKDLAADDAELDNEQDAQDDAEDNWSDDDDGSYDV